MDAIRQNILYKEHQGKTGPETVTLVVNDEVYTGEAAVENLLTMLEQKELPRTGEPKDHACAEDDGDYDEIWEAHGWDHVHEFIDQIPKLESGEEYNLDLRLRNWEEKSSPSIPMFMIGAMMLRDCGPDVKIGCSVGDSKDSENHFSLKRKK